MYLLLFETFSFKNKIVNKIGTLVFGVYLVHENNFLYNSLYQHLPFGINGIIYSKKIIICIFLIPMLIFIISAIIEFLRQKLFDLCSYICKKIKRHKENIG